MFTEGIASQDEKMDFVGSGQAGAATSVLDGERSPFVATMETMETVVAGASVDVSEPSVFEAIYAEAATGLDMLSESERERAWTAAEAAGVDPVDVIAYSTGVDIDIETLRWIVDHPNKPGWRHTAKQHVQVLRDLESFAR